MRLFDEIGSIFYENKHKITTAAIMEVIDELSDLICQEFSKSLNVHYEEVEEKLISAKLKIKRKIDSRDLNDD